MVGRERLELSHHKALEPKSSASTKFRHRPSEGIRFELMVHLTMYDGLATRWFKPLTQPSKLLYQLRFLLRRL